MGDRPCHICEGPHATRNHGADWSEPVRMPASGYVVVPPSEWCSACDEWHPPGLHACSCESSDGPCWDHDEEEWLTRWCPHGHDAEGYDGDHPCPQCAAERTPEYDFAGIDPGENL